MKLSLTAVTGQVADLPSASEGLPHVAADAVTTWNQHINRFVRRAKLSKPIQHEVSQSNYDRLLQDTTYHPRFDGMSADQRKAWLDARVSVA